MIWWILCAIIYIMYTVFAELILHIWHIGTLHCGNQQKRNIALTFDDGPDPVYTSQVLDILRQYHVHATFFLVAERAIKHPELVRQMIADGHEVGSHSFSHKHAWLRGPLGTFRDIARSKSTIEALTGKPLRYYRSPWGAMNWAVVYACRRLNLQQTLWSVRAIDWLAGEYADDVVYRVVSGAHPGAIVLCHDAGGAEGAPLNTIRALPNVIEQLQKLGFSFGTVAELDEARLHHKGARHKSLYAGYPWPRRALIAVWEIVEFFFTRIYRVRTVNAIFRISKGKWQHGERSDEKSGHVTVKQNVGAIDLHFQNETILSFSQANDNRSLVRGLRMTKDGLADIARVLEHHPDFVDVEVIMAFTLMNRGIEMLGFHVEDLPETKSKKRLQTYMRFLMGMYHPEGFSRLQQGTHGLALKLVWMTKQEIIERYGHTTFTVSG